MNPTTYPKQEAEHMFPNKDSKTDATQDSKQRIPKKRFQHKGFQKRVAEKKRLQNNIPTKDAKQEANTRNPKRAQQCQAFLQVLGGIIFSSSMMPRRSFYRHVCTLCSTNSLAFPTFFLCAS